MRALSISVGFFLEAQQAAGAFMNFLHASQNDSMAMVIFSVDVSMEKSISLAEMKSKWLRHWREIAWQRLFHS